jgi:hypothetical protein
MNVMIKDIGHDLHTDVQGVQVCITLFLLMMAALMIPCGKLADRFGRKRLFQLGLLVEPGAVRMVATPPSQFSGARTAGLDPGRELRGSRDAVPDRSRRRRADRFGLLHNRPGQRLPARNARCTHSAFGEPLGGGSAGVGGAAQEAG